MLLGEGETGPNGYRRSLETTWSPNAETDIAVQGTSSMQGPAVSFPDRERDLVIRKRILNYGWGRTLAWIPPLRQSRGEEARATIQQPKNHILSTHAWFLISSFTISTETHYCSVEGCYLKHFSFCLFPLAQPRRPSPCSGK